MSRTAYIGLGSNLGDREATIRRALKLLADTDHIKVSSVSDLIETPPLGYFNQPKFINGVAEVKTTLSAEDLYKTLVEVEKWLGREQHGKWLPRTIDLDLLLFGKQVVNLPYLTIPHPQMHLRTFVLKGLCQLNPGLLHPIMKVRVSELAARLNESDFALSPDVPQVISIAGVIGVGKTTLAKALAEQLDCKLLQEPYDTNPFLPQVYAGRKELALDCQLHFLTNRAEQLSHRTLQRGQIAISDYIFDQERIYASRLLNDQQLALYEQIHKPFSAQVAEPGLVIYLQDSVQKCLERIRRRNRPYEQKIELKFLEGLDSDYRCLFAGWKVCPVIRLSMSNFNCKRNNDIEHLANQVRFYVTAES